MSNNKDDSRYPYLVLVFSAKDQSQFWIDTLVTTMKVSFVPILTFCGNIHLLLFYYSVNMFIHIL